MAMAPTEINLPATQAPAGSEPREVQQPTSVFVREILETILLTLFVFWIVNGLTGRFRIEGQSMEPTMHEGQYVLINKMSYLFDAPQRGDIIVLQFPRDRSRDFIKRVIGVPGDRVEVHDGTVTVNGVLLEEPYIQAPPNYQGVWDVPADQYFVLGDNRNNSHDSHSWSFLPSEDIIGKAWVIYWQPGDWGPVPHYLHSDIPAFAG